MTKIKVITQTFLLHYIYLLTYMCIHCAFIPKGSENFVYIKLKSFNQISD